MPSSTDAIILAGGSSSRMGAGRHKLLLPLGDRPVLAHVVDAALASQVRSIIIVLGHQASDLRAVLAPYSTLPRITLVKNPDYLQGMSTSLHTGLRALIAHNNTGTPTSYSPDSVLILLGDQPLMTAEIIDTLIAARRGTGKQIIAPLYQGRRGNPILFDASLFPELLAVTGDEGARSVVERHRLDVENVEVGSALATYDVDTWEAYQQVVEEWQRQQETHS